MILILLYREYGYDYRLFIYSLLTILLVEITFIDLTQKIIPDRLNILVGIVGGINVLINIRSGLGYILACLVFGIIFLLIAIVTNGGIGGGDIKLIAPLGLIIGFYPMIIVVIYTFVIGAIFSIIALVSKRANLSTQVALAPYISISTIMYILIGNILIDIIANIPNIYT